MQHPDEGKIHAWIDGELPADEASALEAHAGTCAECAAAIAEARGLVAASSRIVNALDVVPGGVIPATAPRRSAWYMSTQVRAAAAVLLVAGASAVLLRDGVRPDATMARLQSEAPAVAVSPVEAERDDAVAADAAASASPELPAAKRAVSGAGAQSIDETRLKETTAASSGTKVGAGRGAAEPLVKQRASSTTEAALDQPVTAALAAGERSEKGRGGALNAAPAPPAPTVAQKPAAETQSMAPPNASERRAAQSLPNVDTSRRFMERRTDGRIRLSVAATVIEPRKLKTEIRDGATRTVYEISPGGTQVTLIERAAPLTLSGKVADATIAVPGAAAAPTAQPSAPPPPPVVRAPTRTAAPALSAAPLAATLTPLDSITWFHVASRRSFVLVGPLSKEILEQIKQGLPPDKR